MLVLARRIGEKVVIDGDVVVTVVEIRGTKVRLGIEAPRARVVHRHEVWDALRRAEAEDEEAREP